jgi:cardiolipin synthase A/B
MDPSLVPIVLKSLLCLFMVLSALHALLYKRDSRAALMWIVSCFLFSGVGALLYWIFGVNRVRTHALELRNRGFWRHAGEAGRHPERHLLPVHHKARRALAALIPMSERVSRRPLMVGNRITMLKNGEEAYPRMIEAIRKAERFVYLATYIFDDDQAGRDFVEALKGAQERGVTVRVLIDGLGAAQAVGGVKRLLKKAGVRYAWFLPLTPFPSGLHLNLRNHRKILVVDGNVGFTGGMNIGDRNRVTLEPVQLRTQDLHFRFEGPILNEFQEVFVEDWFFATKESLGLDPYPSGRLPGRAVCRALADGPNEDFEKFNWILLGVLSWARKSVRIMTPYFVPTRELIAGLNTAALRGVRVEVVLPAKNNHRPVDWACRASLWEMMPKGVRFFEQPPPFNHSKLLVADGIYALVGSANMDNRSLRLNFEFNVEVYEPGFTMKLERHFAATKKRSRILTLAEMDGKPLWVKVRNRLARLFSPFL